MEDNLEKVTINIDSNYAEFTSDSEFYVDMVDSIKNCIYIKTLKTELYITRKWKANSMYDGISRDVLQTGDYIYIQLNDFNRIKVPSKEIIPKLYTDLIYIEADATADPPITEYKEEAWPAYGATLKNRNNWYDEGLPSGNSDVVYINQVSALANIAQRRGFFDNPVNFLIKEEKKNLLNYYDSVYINKNPDFIGGIADLYSYGIYRQELSGTSCGPNDTNTLVLNPIYPEIKRFNVKLWRVNENGKHVELPISKRELPDISSPENDNGAGILRVKLLFTLYYKRKNITRI